MLIEKDTLPQGSVLFGYEIVERVGEGGWAYVYKARHPKLPKVVALKQLKPALVRDERNLQRFLHEADIVAQINHPNVITIHDLLYDKETRLHYIVTELADKGSLADRLEKSAGGLPIDQVLHIAIGICSGLEAVHRKGVIHRDIKPSNILLFDVGEERDVPKLIDFGIAKAPPIEGKDIPKVSPKVSGIYGSIPYMSPEQLDDEIEVDNRSDLYSLGISLYELLTGQVPFTGKIEEIFWAHLYVSPKSLREIRADVPEQLEQIVLRALHKERKERYQSAAAMHEALRAIVDASVRKDRQRELQILLEQGEEHLDKKMWTAAVETFRRASSLEPDNERVVEGLVKSLGQQQLKRLYNLGIQRLEEKNWEEARERLVDVMGIDPDYEDGRAKELLKQATQKLEQERNQSNLMAQYRTGMGYFHTYQWVPAITELEQVVVQDPEFEDAAERLAEAQQYVHAERAFKQAQRHAALGEWREAIAFFEEVELLEPPHVDVTEELQYATKQWEKFEEEQQLDKWYDEGMSQLAAGNLDGARAHFENIDEIRSDYRDVSERLKAIGEKLHVNQLLERAYEHEAAREWKQASRVCREVLTIDHLNREAIRCLDRVQRRSERKKSNWLLNCLLSPIAAVIIGVACTFFATQLATAFFASFDTTQFILSIVSLLFIFVPSVMLIQWLVAQRAKAEGNSQTDQ